MLLDPESVRMLIKNGESPTLELKVAPPRPSELAERVCGFANSALGGTIIIGVADQTLAITGVKSTANAIDTILQAARQCKPVVALVPPQPQVVDLSGKKLVIAHIPPNNGELYQAGNVFWLRRGTHTVGMEKRELLDFVYRQGVMSWETQPLTLATLDDLDLDQVRIFLEQRPVRNRQSGRLNDLTQILLTLKCAAKLEHDEVIHPTNAGMLLFGYAPQNYFTQAEIIATYYQDNLGVRRYTDRKILGGTLAEQIDQAEDYLKLRIPVAARTEGFHRIDEPDLPLEALREAVVNAVAHRDYSIEGTAVRIFFYPDRIEIHNPGLLLPGVTLEDLQQGRAPSRPRNPVLASVLRELPGGYMERMGSGISFMIEQMRALNLPDPQFREQGEFIVTFFRQPATTTQSNPTQPTNTATPSITTSPTPGANTPTPDEPTSPTTNQLLPQAERLEIALRFVHTNGSITNKQYRELINISESTAVRDLEILIERGSLRALGNGRGRYYTL